MRTIRIVAIGAVLAAVGMLLQITSSWISSEIIPEWFVLRRVSVTTLVFSSLTSIVAILLIVSAAAFFGTRLGRHFDIRQEYRRLLGSVGTGTAIGILSVFLILPLLPPTSGTIEFDSLVLFGIAYLSFVVDLGLIVTLAVFAGAAFQQLQYAPRQHRGGSGTRNDDPQVPANANSNTDTELHTDVA